MGSGIVELLIPVCFTTKGKLLFSVPNLYSSQQFLWRFNSIIIIQLADVAASQFAHACDMMHRRWCAFVAHAYAVISFVTNFMQIILLTHLHLERCRISAASSSLFIFVCVYI